MPDGDVHYELEKIVWSRRTKNNKLQYKVRWEGYGPADDSWIDEDDLAAPRLIREFHRKNPTAVRAAWLSRPLYREKEIEARRGAAP